AHATVAATPEACDRFLADITAQVGWIKTFSVADPAGRVVCASRPEAIGIDLSDRVYFRQAVQSGQYVLSDYAVGRLNATPVVIALYPQRDATGAIQAVLIGVLDSVWIGRLANATAGRPRSAVLMVDGEGAGLTHQPDGGNWSGREFANPPLIRAMLSRPEGVVTESGLDGIRRVFGFVQLPGTQTRLAIGLDENEILSRVNREMRYAYLQLAVVGAILLL